jgi:hypothetical protein
MSFAMATARGGSRRPARSSSRSSVVLASVVDRDHVRRVHLRERPCLPKEPRARRLVLDERRRQELDRDVPVEREVGGLEHLAHPAVAERAVELISLREHGREGRSGRRRGKDVLAIHLLRG